jgi:pimeloyl-ACP methyl ester carboxylesterase
MAHRAAARLAGSLLAGMLAISAPPAAQAGAARTAAVPRFVHADCPPHAVLPPNTDCGFLIVLQNRDVPGEGTIRVAVAIVHAQSPHPKPDPILFLQGGPSFPALDPNGFSAAYFAGTEYAADHDVILFDQRGVGASRPLLNCPEFDRLDASTFPGHPTERQALAAIGACHDRLLAHGVDFSAYSMEDTAADVRDLRTALGIPSWNILGLSAGGFIALTTMRLYPEGIRSVVLDSPLDPHTDRVGSLWQWNNQVLRLVFRGCAADPVCDREHPNLPIRFWRFVHHLRAHPAKVTVRVQGDGTITQRVDGDTFLLDTLGCASFPQGCTGFVPAIVDDAIHGGLQRQYGGTITPPEPIAGILAEARTAAYTCHDIVAFETRAGDLRAARRLPEYRDFILDPSRKLECRVWKAGRADPSQHHLVVSGIPTLILTGEFDAASGGSAMQGRNIARGLSNHFLYELPAQGHIALFRGCPRHLAAQFLERPTRQPNARCVSRMREVDFSPNPAGAASAFGSVVRTSDLAGTPSRPRDVG